MKKILLIIAVAIGFAACKTTEANFRDSYDKAVAARDSDDIDLTIYGGAQRQLGQTFVISGNDTVAVSVKQVSVLDGSDAAKLMQAYNVVVGQFKQKFNAQSLCKRWRDNGYPNAFVVYTAEPYYYIVAATFAKAGEARRLADTLRKNSPVAMREPAPFILNDPRK